MVDIPKPEVIVDIVEEHFEELDILWAQRERIAFAPDWNLAELAEHEERCEAHLDGLRLARGHAVEIARPALSGDERGAAAAATMVFLAIGHSELDAELLAMFADAEDAILDGIRIGLRYGDNSRIASDLERLANEGSETVRAAALDVLAFHRQAPPPTLGDFLANADPAVRARLYPAIGRFGGPWTSDDLQRALDSEDGVAKRAALEASARVGLPGLRELCRRAATHPDEPCSAALEFLGVVGEASDVEALQTAIAHPSLASSALAGLGALGAVETIPVLIDAMRDPAVSSDAGAAFCRVTGAEGIEADAALPPPEDLPEEELDFFDPVVPADPVKAGAWWEREQQRFADGGRWQDGKSVAEDPLGDVFDTLPLQSRRDVYLGCRSRSPGDAPDLELESRARLQRRSASP